MWYFHALERYLAATGDRDTLELLIPKLVDIIEHHTRGTRFGIRLDPTDRLLKQGEEGYQLTWMDAKVGDWVVTPRRGKTVEINALWYNALRLMESWIRQTSGEHRSCQIRRSRLALPRFLQAHSSIRGCAFIPTILSARADFWKGLKRILAMRVSVRSAKSSMPPNRSSREDASRKPGV
jgi:hypothetical protein